MLPNSVWCDVSSFQHDLWLVVSRRCDKAVVVTYVKWLKLSDASQVSIVVVAVILRVLGKPCSPLSSRADGLYQCCQFWCNMYGPIRAKHCCFSLIALWRFKLHFKPLAIDALSPKFLPPVSHSVSLWYVDRFQMKWKIIQSHEHSGAGPEKLLYHKLPNLT